MITSEWTNFSTNLPHIKEWRTVGNNLEIREEVMCPAGHPDSQHDIIVQCETWKQSKFFSLPPQFGHASKKLTSHTVMAKKNEGETPYYSIIINTVIPIKPFYHVVD